MCQVFLRRKIIRNYYQATGNHVSISKIKSFTKGRKYFRRMLPPGWPQGLSLLATPAVAYHRLDPIAYGYQSGSGTDWSLHAPFGGSNLDFCPGTWWSSFHSLVLRLPYCSIWPFSGSSGLGKPQAEWLSCLQFKHIRWLCILIKTLGEVFTSKIMSVLLCSVWNMINLKQNNWWLFV